MHDERLVAGEGQPIRGLRKLRVMRQPIRGLRKLRVMRSGALDN